HYVIDLPAGVKDGDVVGVAATEKDKKPANSATITIDRVAPEAPQVDPIKGGDTTITGKAEPDSTVTIVDKDGNVLGEGKADKDGNFTIQVPAVSEGDKVFVTATDQNGNESKPTEAIVDGVAPAAPIVNPVKDGDTTVTGKAEPDSTVTVTDKDGNVVGEGKTDKDGNFTVTIPPAKGGDKLFVTATDKNGNVSGKATVEVASGAAGTVVKVKTTKTGDLFNMMPIFILMLIAAMGIFITTVMMRRARQK
ncbi:MAG: Ig-like domain-containing protein, partial [Anaerovoracaceae bacterium]